MGHMNDCKLPLLSTMQDEHFRDLALRMALHCVRNTIIEDYHAAGKLTDPEMAALNREVANKLYSFLVIMLSPDYASLRKNVLAWLYPPFHWDEPKFDESFLNLVKVLRRSAAMPPWIKRLLPTEPESFWKDSQAP